MAANKVEINGETVLDLTEDSVTPETMLEGTTAHNAAGEEIKGLLQVVPSMVVNITSQTDDDGGIGYSADKTFDEIAEAIQSGTFLRAVFNGSEFYYSGSVYRNDTLNQIHFTQNAIAVQQTFVVSPLDIWSLATAYIPSMNVSAGALVKRKKGISTNETYVDAAPGTDYMAPVPVTTENDGSVLAVADGEWGVQQLVTETWTFTLEDDSEVTKTIVTGVSQAL